MSGPIPSPPVGGGGVTSQRIPLLAAAVSTDGALTDVVGGGYLDPTGLTTLTLEVLAAVVSGAEVVAELYDLTAATVVATVTVATTVAGTRHTASVTVPGTARSYELRVRRTVGTDPDYGFFTSASLIGS